MATVIHLRAETKPFERRSPMSPQTAKALIQAGYLIRVEQSRERIYNDNEFKAIGAEIAFKELPNDDIPLSHTYIHFQHIFKKQHGWACSLSRFARGGGTLYDLEFLTDESGHRVAAFGYWAGYAGAAIALLSWAHQVLHLGVTQGPVPLFDSIPLLIQHIKSAIKPAIQVNSSQPPRVIILGALGRCGKGAIDFCLAAELSHESILKWDMAETSRGGPFAEITAADIFINCVYLGPTPTPTPPFATFESLSAQGRRLRVICDVSCDPNSENNPVPLYSGWSSFDNPTIPLSKDLRLDGPELRVIAIDHLPTLIPRESSNEYSASLLPSLLSLERRENEGVWKKAEQIYKDRVAELSCEI